MSVKPELAIAAIDTNGKRTYRFSFYLPRGTGYTAHCKSAAFVCDIGDSLSARVEPANTGIGHLQTYEIIIESSGAQKSVAQLASVVKDDEAPSDLIADLHDAVQRALFDAMRTLIPTLAAPVAPAAAVGQASAEPGVAAAVASSGARPRVTARTMVIGGMLAVGVAVMGYGAFVKRPAPVDANVVGTGDYSDLQEKIRQQITAAANSPTPAATTQNMDNISIATMRAMGLDPGKANAGCLVGVQ